MTRQALLDLAVRCEQATGPDRELDAEIAKAVGAKHGPFEKVSMETRSVTYYDEIATAYSASIDAALTLVPEGCQYQLDSHYHVARVWHYWEPYCADDDGSEHFDAEANTEALALCAAAIRAKAKEMNDGGS